MSATQKRESRKKGKGSSTVGTYDALYYRGDVPGIACIYRTGNIQRGNDSEYSQQRVCVSLSGIGLTAQFVPVPRRGVHKEEEEGEGEGDGEEEEKEEVERQHQ